MTALGFGQAPSVATSSCTIGHRMVTPKNPQTGPDGNFLPGQSIVQLGSALYDETTIRVIEHPMSAKDDLDAYRSTIVVTQRNMRQEYSLAQHIKYGSLYRIVEFASFCPSPDREIVYLAFETPSTGASEAFVVLQLLPEGIDFHALPEANEGRIVIRTSDPTRVELWSATGNADRTGCDAGSIIRYRIAKSRSTQLLAIIEQERRPLAIRASSLVDESRFIDPYVYPFLL